MKKSPYSSPESFVMAPLLELLPLEGNLTRLAENADSLYARLERVRELKVALGTDSGSVAKEEAMLQLVVNWMADGLGGVK